MYKHISYEEIKSLYEKLNTPMHVIKHCEAVSKTAKGIALMLNKKGYDFDVELIEKSGLLHDAARIMENHGIYIAQLLSEMGYTREADTVREHMTYNLNDINNLNEVDIMCLGDRLVLEDRYVGLEERIKYIIEKAIKGGHGDAVPNIIKAKEETGTLLKEIEAIIGQRVDELFL